MEIAVARFKMNMAVNAAEHPQKELDFVIHALLIPPFDADLPIGAGVANSLLSRD
ncbi:MAG: hypothetical protein HLUCCA13_05445 [Halomonas sp. HL-48]|nr:hypothetical protein [Halomonas sp. HL-48]KPQ25472.1 MAG: hypothetical protein HLUCCA13_05445 [Halomonas sp. HL-48]